MKQFEEVPRYFVSEDGEIWDSKRKRFLPQCYRQKGMGYKCVTLCINGEYKLCSVHRIVAKTFLPNPDNLPFVNHKDEDPSNNKVDNLEWCTPAYNSGYGTRGIRSGLAQRNRPDCSKGVTQFDLSGKKIAEFPSAMEAHRQTKVGRPAICKVCNHQPKYYTAGGFLWEWTKEIVYGESS